MYIYIYVYIYIYIYVYIYYIDGISTEPRMGYDKRCFFNLFLISVDRMICVLQNCFNRICGISRSREFVDLANKTWRRTHNSSVSVRGQHW